MRHNEVEYPFLPKIRTLGSQRIHKKQKKSAKNIEKVYGWARTTKIGIVGEDLASRPNSCIG